MNDPIPRLVWIHREFGEFSFVQIVNQGLWSSDRCERSIRQNALWEMNDHRRAPPKIFREYRSTLSSELCRQHDQWVYLAFLARLKRTCGYDDELSILKFRHDGIEIRFGGYGPFIRERISDTRDATNKEPICMTFGECRELLSAESATELSNDGERRRRMLERMRDLWRFANSYADWYSAEQSQIANSAIPDDPPMHTASVTEYSDKEIENIERLLEFDCETNADHLRRAEYFRMLGRFKDTCRELANLAPESKEETIWRECLGRMAKTEDRFVARLD